jgi:O-antigen/teichoic acid export membrane protein
LQRVDADTEPARDHRRALTAGAVPLIITAVTVALLLVIDLLSFKRVATDADVGVYNAAAMLAHVPYFLLQAAAIVVLPSVAAARESTDLGKVISRALGTTIALLALPTAVLVAVGDAVLADIFGTTFSASGTAVAGIAVATAGVTIHATFVSIDAGLGRLREAVAISVTGVVALAVAVSFAGSGSDIQGAAWAAAAVCGTLGLVHAVLVTARTRAAPSAATLAAVGVSIAFAYVAHLVVDSIALLFALILVGGLAYLALLVPLGLLHLRAPAVNSPKADA